MAEKHDQPQVGSTSTSSMNAKTKSKRPKTKKLDFNAPLLSTRPRRMCRSTSSRTSRSYTAERIPFCWEQVPGKPKHMHQTTTTTPDHQLPPSGWHPSSSTSFDFTTHSTTEDNCIIQLSDGFDADIDDDDENGMFSDAMDDMFSLSEAIDFVEKEAEKAQSQRGHGLDGFDIKTAVSSECEDYPSFIIQRFLPAATALAASSVVNKKQMMNGSVFSENEQKIAASGCGLEKLFTWRMKHHHKPCGIKSPVCQSSSVNLKCQQHLRGRTRPDGFKGSKS